MSLSAYYHALLCNAFLCVINMAIGLPFHFGNSFLCSELTLYSDCLTVGIRSIPIFYSIWIYVHVCVSFLSSCFIYYFRFHLFEAPMNDCHVKWVASWNKVFSYQSSQIINLFKLRLIDKVRNILIWKLGWLLVCSYSICPWKKYKMMWKHLTTFSNLRI